MKRFNSLYLLLLAVLVFFTSCSDDDNTEPQYQGVIPAVEKTSIAIDEELEISYSSTLDDGFSYEIIEGDEFVSVTEQDDAHYIRGEKSGIATLLLSNIAGEDTVTIKVLAAPGIETNTIDVGKEIEIFYSSTSEDGFSYEITSGGDFVSVIEKDGIHYIEGVDRGEATLILSNSVGDTTVTVSVQSVPVVEETTIGINEELAIKYSSTAEDGFLYQFSEGADFASVIEKDGAHYLKGIEEGEATLVLTNNDGDSTITINVVSKVELVGEYYQDYQGVRYNLDTDNNTASLAGSAANKDVDLTDLEGKITIPANVYYEGEKYPVTSVESKSFSEDDGSFNSTLKSLYFAEGSNIEEIAGRAFRFCDNLVSVDLSNCASLDSIGTYAFYDCGNLATLNFSGCTSLNSINSYSFSYTDNLTTVDLSGCISLVTVEIYAFAYGNDAILVTLPGEASEWKYGSGTVMPSNTIDKYKTISNVYRAE